MTGRALVTGATGILGVEVRAQLEAAGWDVTGVARRVPAGSGIVGWDLSADPAPDVLCRPWDLVVNGAADTRWSQTAAEAHQANVVSALSVAKLAGAGTHLVQISTAAVVGPRADGSSSDPGDYRNLYEWSKAQAERELAERVDRLTVIRPSLIIGRRRDGAAARFAGFYMLLRGFTASSVPAVVADRQAGLDIVPVDDVAAVVVEAAQRPPPRRVLTPVGGPASPPVSQVVEQMCSALNDWRAQRGVPPIDTPPIVEPDSWRRFYRPFADELFTRRQRLTLDNLDYFLPYLEMETPWSPDPVITDGIDAVAPSVRYWADTNPRLASLSPRAWEAATA